MIEYNCPICGKECVKYPSSSKVTCGNPDCTLKQKSSHKAPREGMCSICGRFMKLERLGARRNTTALCRSCHIKMYRHGMCGHCGKLGRLQGQGLCQQCYIKLDANSRKVICKKCGTLKSHYAKGLCSKCYTLISVMRWQKNNPEKFKAILRVSQKKYRQAHLEEAKAYQRKYCRVKRARTPERMDRLMDGTSFVTSDNLGVEKDKIPARCIGKFELGTWKRVVVYVLPDQEHFKAQVIHLKDGKQEFLMFQKEGLMEYLKANGIEMVIE